MKRFVFITCFHIIRGTSSIGDRGSRSGPTRGPGTLSQLPFMNISNAELLDSLESIENKIKKKLDDQNFKQFIKTHTLYEDLGECRYYTTEEFNKHHNSNNSIPNVKILHNNIRSLDKHFNNIVAFINTLELPDIIAFSEIGKKNIPNRKKQLQKLGYSMRSEIPTKIRGGVALVFKDTIKVKKRKKLKIKKPANLRDLDIENLWYEINLPNIGPTVIGVCYKHPNSTKQGLQYFRDCLRKTMQTINNENKCGIILGDINIDGLRINHNEESKKFFDTCLEEDFIPLITTPTRIQDDKCSTIDHIIVNGKFITSTSSRAAGNIYSDISDHLPNILVAQGHTISKTNRLEDRPLVRIFGEKNTNKFENEINKANWNALYQCTDPRSALNEFYKIYNPTFNTCFPLKNQSRKRSKDKPWITPEIRHEINIKSTLIKKAINSPSDHNKEALKKARNKVTFLCQKAQNDYYYKKIKEGKDTLKALWDIAGTIVNPKKSRKNTVIDSLKINNKIVHDKQQICDAINDFFSNIGKNLADKIDSNVDYKTYLRAPNPNSMALLPTDTEEVKKIILNLKSNKAAGDDNVRPSLIKRCCESLAGPITHIINLSLSSGVVPDKLKVAKVIPVFKKNDKQDPGNYRPISLLSIINKILEKVMYARVMSFLKKFNLLYKYQFGFREGHSTTQAVIEITDNILEELNKQNMVAGIYLDLSKAFDTVCHKILLAKLEHYGVRGKALTWFQSYLNNRKQYTTIGPHKSREQEVPYGVPQGSVLGPLLFLIFVNDIDAAVDNNKLRLFADDSNVFVVSKDPAILKERMINVIQKLCKWFNANKLTINMSKTAYTIFTPDGRIPGSLNSITINNIVLTRVGSVKYLGIHLDDNLNWDVHINEITKKLTKTIQALKIVSNFISTEHKRILYYAYIYSTIQYGIEVYSQGNKGGMKKIQIKQNRALKVLYKKDFLTPTLELHREAKVLLVNDIAKLNILKFVYKQRHGETPDAFRNYYIENMFIHAHNTRQAKNLHITTNKNKFGRKSLKYRGAVYWNETEGEIREAKSIKCFAKNIKNNIIEEY